MMFSVLGLGGRSAAGRGRGVLVGVLVGVLFGVFVAGVPAVAAPVVGWSVRAAAEPSVFSAKDALGCEAEEKCDRYQLLVQNLGGKASEGVVTLKDVLPAGITLLKAPVTEEGGSTERRWSCTPGAGNTSVTCTFVEDEVEEEPGSTVPGSVAAGHYAPFLDIIVSAPANTTPRVLKNEVTVESENAASASSVLETPANTPALPFSVSEFSFEPGGETGEPELQAGAHPWELTTSLGVPVVAAPTGSRKSSQRNELEPVKYIKNVSVELPLGFFGNPLAVISPEEECTEVQLQAGRCPPESRVGTFAFSSGFFTSGEFAFTESSLNNGKCCSAVYDMRPDAGYPAEFGFTFAKNPVVMYASTVHTPAGYRLRVLVPGVPEEIALLDSRLTFYGEPGKLNGSGNENAFLTNPVDCAAGGLSARVEMSAWSEPEHYVSRETTAYPGITGCNVLQFNPTLSLAPTPAGEKEPGTSEADEPSSYTGTLKIPQDEAFSGQATPELRTATVTLPEGVTINPPGGEGLAACQAEGPEGINIGSSHIGPAGQDLGDPEATELGAGYEGGNGSRYDDGVYHTASGHCPAASAVGTVEATTPVLSEPLTGHVYVAQPKCGGAGQHACTEASATNGELFETYLELQNEKAGVIVKLAATLSANPVTGQLTAHFSENPQFPVEEVKLHLNSGPRAPLANPQTCGTATTSSLLEPWSQTPSAVSSSSFAVTGCAATMPFAPAFAATSTPTPAAGSGTFTLTLARQDREGDLAGFTLALPPGLAAHFAQITRCEEPQAQTGACPSSSEIGTATAGAGAGADPLYLSGPVYLTGPYQGAPFGLTTVIPAKAGPFNLGNVVVRSKITVNPRTAQGTVTTASLPQIVDGVPVRLRAVNVTIKEGFIVNPTSCAPEQINATITSAQGASETAASPLQATGCEGLTFKPVFTETTSGKTSKLDGASLTVNLTQGPGQANIHKVDVQIPNSLPSRLTTLQKACLEAQFNANPAGCPAASDVGTATAVTPLLNDPLTGPAYLVARGTEFPDLEFVLQGQNVTIILDGQTDIKKGITYSNFETVPDAPVSSFHAEFPEGPYSILAANVNLCKPTETITITKHVYRRVKGHRRRVAIKVKKTIPKPLDSPTTITAQNGATIKQTTPITVTQCPTTKPTTKPKPKPKKTKHGKK